MTSSRCRTSGCITSPAASTSWTPSRRVGGAPSTARAYRGDPLDYVPTFGRCWCVSSSGSRPAPSRLRAPTAIDAGGSYRWPAQVPAIPVSVPALLTRRTAPTTARSGIRDRHARAAALGPAFPTLVPRSIKPATSWRPPAWSSSPAGDVRALEPPVGYAAATDELVDFSEPISVPTREAERRTAGDRAELEPSTGETALPRGGPRAAEALAARSPARRGCGAVLATAASQWTGDEKLIVPSDRVRSRASRSITHGGDGDQPDEDSVCSSRRRRRLSSRSSPPPRRAETLAEIKRRSFFEACAHPDALPYSSQNSNPQDSSSIWPASSP